LHIAPSGSPQPTKQAFFANYIRAFRAFSHSKNLTAVYAYRKAKETQFYGRNSARNLKSFFGDVFFARQGF
jgi:hypothetical protein